MSRGALFFGTADDRGQTRVGKNVQKVVLAYSGGLDTSVILRWLIETYNCEVVAYCADLGQGEELIPVRDNVQMWFAQGSKDDKKGPADALHMYKTVLDAERKKEKLPLTSKLSIDGYPFLVAELADAVAGYAYAGPYRTRPAYRFTVEDSIYVAPQAQRGGIGRALLKRLLDDAQARGFRQMIAVIGDSAQTPSIALHRACGFRFIGTFEAVGFKFERWLDSVLMQRALGPGGATAP